ncbi:MAG: phosphonate ABC transporter ATP-binding protein [Gammaproteobacteria bacterium]
MNQTSSTAEEILRLDSISVTYPNGTVALQKTSLSLKQSEFTVLLGLSGAGKSSLLRTMNLLVVPSTGKVHSAGIGAITGKRLMRAHRRHTAMIFQQHQLLSRKSALINVLTGRLSEYPAWRTVMPLPHADVQIAYECLQRVGLGEKAFTRVDNLSGGQMQRVGIARALAQQPRLILADEPVASLDPTTSVQVLAQLDRISREDGIATIVSLHQLELARRFAQRIIGLADGRVVFDGPPADLDQSTLDQIYGNTNVQSHTTAGAQVDTSDLDSAEVPIQAAI